MWGQVKMYVLIIYRGINKWTNKIKEQKNKIYKNIVFSTFDIRISVTIVISGLNSLSNAHKKEDTPEVEQCFCLGYFTRQDTVYRTCLIYNKSTNQHTAYPNYAAHIFFSSP